MPNYCNNTLEVSVDPKNREALKQFEDFVKTSIIEDGERFTFEGVLPMPKSWTSLHQHEMSMKI